MASGVTNRGAFLFATGLDWTSADLRWLVITSAVPPTHGINTVAELLTAGAVELVGGGSGYARGTLSGMTVVQDDANNRAKIDASDVVFGALAASAGTPAYLVVYLAAGSDALRQVIGWTDHTSGALVPNGAPYTLAFNASGLFVGDTDAA